MDTVASSLVSSPDDLCKLTVVTTCLLSGIHSEMNRPMLIRTIKGGIKSFGTLGKRSDSLSAGDENKDTF